MLALRARWLVPIDRPPIEDGVVTIDGGRIVAVGENTSGQSPRDLGDVALLPGLVNAHTHLEFSLLNKPLGQPGMPFVGWLSEVVASRAVTQQQLSETDLASHRAAAIAAGWAESYAGGIAAVGEISQMSVSIDEYASDARPMAACLFGEVIGLAQDRVGDLTSQARQYIQQDVRHLQRLNLGISPHAPYTIHPQLLTALCQRSAESRTPVAMHLAESREELALLASREGPLAEFLASLHAWHPASIASNSRPLDYLKTLATAHRTLVIHCNYLAADEIAFLGAHQDYMSIVYCPRTHAYFGREPYPLAQTLSAGARVAVGTDSRASNPDLKLFEELRHIARHYPSVSPDAILRMGTLSGAEALGLADFYGSITPGKQAAFIAIRLTDPKSPLESILHGDSPHIDPLDVCT
jgi:cytosine/adenosine deaminase-related metal-dependent hydrolase